MSILSNYIPLALYIHIPWCVKKCPYCDFNSHSLKDALPEKAYIEALLQDFRQDLSKIQNRTIESIFIGGGTPSLFSAESLADLLTRIKQYTSFSPSIEITMEANPGTIEQAKFSEFRGAGINRLSLGIQSFQAEKLKTLGRIHNDKEAIAAIHTVKQAGFDNFNLDLMFGLPSQTIDDALFDLQTAVELNPTHISWYQLTLEPNTLFFHSPPKLPEDDLIWDMQTAGQSYLAAHQFQQYEISAYAKNGFQCRHNRNYWEFGDYIGIGAGAHSKMTDLDEKIITRAWKTKHPKDYLNPNIPRIAGEKNLMADELPLEFMMNAMRLLTPVSIKMFADRTGLSKKELMFGLNKAEKQGLLIFNEEEIIVTELGRRYLNDVLENFINST